MILGVDVSKWQGRMNWYQTRAAGARFAYVRAGSIRDVDGYCYTDDEFEFNSNTAPDYLPVGFYWYFRPNWNPVAQADYLANLIKGRRWVLRPVVDVECDGGLSDAAVTNAVKAFCYQVYHHLDRLPMVYTRAEWWNSETADDPLWEDLELWIARYINLLGPWSDGNCKPRDWNDWTLWQFSANNNGRGHEFGAQSMSIDLDCFNGDEAAFALYVEGWSGPVKVVKVSSPLAVTLRSAPDGMTVGATWQGRTFPVKEVSPDGKWLKVEAWLPADKVKEV